MTQSADFRERPMAVSAGITVDDLPLQTASRFRLVVPGQDASAVGIGVHVAVGRRRRPCLALAAGAHGDEYDGVVALQEIARATDPRQLQGTLIIVPVVNPFAFEAGQRRTPEDGKDLNRVFPGSTTGSLSERLAHCVSTKLLCQADLVFTLHGATAQSLLLPWVEFFDQPTPVGAATYEAAMASGFGDLVALPPSPGVLQTALAQTGVPVIEGEVGGLGETRPDNVRYYKQRVAAVARHAGILPAAEQSPAAGAPRIWHLCPVETAAGGMFVRQVSLGDSVRAGDEMGALYDLQGEKVDIVRAPRDGVVGGCRIHAGVRPGDRLFTLWARAVPRLAGR